MIEDFAHRLTMDRIRDGERVDLVADDKERRAIAERLDLPSLDRLEAHASLERDGETVRATGRVAASLEQRCVVTGEPVAAHLDEPFDIAFVPEPRAGEVPEEVELSKLERRMFATEGPLTIPVMRETRGSVEAGSA